MIVDVLYQAKHKRFHTLTHPPRRHPPPLQRPQRGQTADPVRVVQRVLSLAVPRNARHGRGDARAHGPPHGPQGQQDAFEARAVAKEGAGPKFLQRCDAIQVRHEAKDTDNETDERHRQGVVALSARAGHDANVAV